MNSVVKSWNRAQQKSTVQVPDRLIVDGEKVIFQETQNTKAKVMGNPQHKVSVNFDAVHEFAVHGPQDRIESLFIETHRTVQRLGLTVGNVKILPSTTRNMGGRPSVHDLTRWLDNLDTENEKYDEDCKFFWHIFSCIDEYFFGYVDRDSGTSDLYFPS